MKNKKIQYIVGVVAGASLMIILIIITKSIVAVALPSSQTNNILQNSRRGEISTQSESDFEMPPPYNDQCAKRDKIAVCHLVPGNIKNEYTICIPPAGVKNHLAHGDTIGICDNK